MQHEASSHAPYETGGLLLGYRHSPQELVITDIIGAGPTAIHRRTSFQPDSDWQTAELARRYAAADRRLHYLGDWHSHPGGTSTLSATDRRTMRCIARSDEARCPQPIMVVLAGEEPWTFVARQLRTRQRWRNPLEELPIKLYGTRIEGRHDGRSGS